MASKKKLEVVGKQAASSADEAVESLAQESAPKRLRQAEIPGTERPKHPEIDAAAEVYVRARDKRVAASKDEVSAKESLIAAMKAAGVRVYRDDEADPPLTVMVTPGKPNVKVTQMDAAEDDEEGGEAA